MKAGLVLALWEVTTHVSLGVCLYIFAGPTSGTQMEPRSRAELPGKKILFSYQMRMLIATYKEF
jgi:hypothetical protein